MRQLDLDRLSFGLRGCLWGRHGLVRFLFRCDPAGPDHFTCNREAAASPWLALSQRDFPTGERVFRRRTEETCASQGLAWRWAGRFLARESLAYWCPANNWEPRGRCVLDNEGQHRKRENAEQEGDSFLLKRYNARSLPSVCGLILRSSAF